MPKSLPVFKMICEKASQRLVLTTRRWFDVRRQNGLVYVQLSLFFAHNSEAYLFIVQPLLAHFAQPHILSDGLPIYRRLQSDDQDSVRLLTVEDLIVLAQRLSPAEVKEQLLKQIRHSIGDKSWRVRYMAANHFNEVCLLL